MLSLKFHPQMLTGIQHLQKPISSPTTSKIHFKKAQTIQLVKKLTCAEELQEARAHAQVRNIKKAHMRSMHNCVCKNMRTFENNTFMVLFCPVIPDIQG
jgi:hypothetical protein